MLCETLVGHTPLTLKGVTAGPVVTPKLVLNGAAQRLVSLKHLFTWAHCLGAVNHICLQIWLTVLQHKCFMPGSNLLYILYFPTLCSFPCITYSLVLALSCYESNGQGFRDSKARKATTGIYFDLL